MVRKDIDYLGLAERIKFVYCKNVAQRLLICGGKTLTGFNKPNRRLVLEAFSNCLKSIIEFISDEMEYDYSTKEIEIIFMVMGELLLRETVALLGAEVPVKCWQGMLSKSAFIAYEVVKELTCDQYPINDIFKTAKIQAQIYFKRDLFALRDEKDFINNDQCKVALRMLNIPLFLQKIEIKKLYTGKTKKNLDWKNLFFNAAKTIFHYSILIAIVAYMVR